MRVQIEDGDIRVQAMRDSSDGVPFWKDLVVVHKPVDFLVNKGVTIAMKAGEKLLGLMKGAKWGG